MSNEFLITELLPDRRQGVAEALFKEGFFAQRPAESFSEAAIDFLDSVSRRLLLIPKIKEYPDWMALGFWMRRASVSGMILGAREAAKLRAAYTAARGVAFHVAPSNMDTMFMYSMALSIMAGNVNIVRISRRTAEKSALFLEVIGSVFSEARYEDFARANRIITYERDAGVNAFFSSRADVRMLWGGDDTIREFRRLDTKASAKDVVFRDKVSFCVIRAEALLGSATSELEALAVNFYNDAYWAAQKACSSPQEIFFIGCEADCLKASAIFWGLVENQLRVRGRGEEPIAVAMDKTVRMHESAMEASDRTLPRDSDFPGAPSVLRVSMRDARVLLKGCGGGFFYEVFGADLDALRPFLNEKGQTLTHWGFERSTMEQWIRSVKGQGFDRVVPVGKALEFAPVWDSYDLLCELTRQIAC